MKKKDRLSAIEKIIAEKEIETQEELSNSLGERGITVSQSTLSRDINDLNLIKVSGISKKFKYVKASTTGGNFTEKTVNLFKQVTVSMACANNLLVIKTLAGNANSAGVAFDEMCFPQVLGTVAGDDTLLVVAKTNFDAEIILKTLRTL